LSHSKLVYVLTKGHLIRFQNNGIGKCRKCAKNFKENDIIATSTSKHYCYECAIKINLVTGKINKDLHNEDFISEVFNHIKLLAQKYSISKNIKKLALKIIKTAFNDVYYVSKNKLGLAYAAIVIATKIEKQVKVELDNDLPTTRKSLQKNIQLLQKSLVNTRCTLDLK
jgi:transcription initiation factor TFIIIB Brf1 subunit/transcription initiation factor TFIIB